MDRELEGTLALVTGGGNGGQTTGHSTVVAQAVVFPASSRASIITRQPLLVDGGFAAM